jgi:hypothetical protein
VFFGEDAVEECGFPGSEEAGEDRDGNARHPKRVMDKRPALESRNPSIERLRHLRGMVLLDLTADRGRES